MCSLGFSNEVGTMISSRWILMQFGLRTRVIIYHFWQAQDIICSIDKLNQVRRWAVKKI